MRCRFRTYRMFRVPFITCELGDTSCMLASTDDFLMYEVKLSSFSMNYVICSVLQLYTWICFSFLIFMLIDNHLLIFGCNFQLQLFFGKPPKSPNRNGAAAMQPFALAVWILWTTPATKEGGICFSATTWHTSPESFTMEAGETFNKEYCMPKLENVCLLFMSWGSFSNKETEKCTLSVICCWEILYTYIWSLALMFSLKYHVFKLWSCRVNYEKLSCSMQVSKRNIAVQFKFTLP